MIRNNLILLVFLFSVFRLFSQENPNCFRVYLTDKENSPYSVTNPSAFLSQRAIDKRTRFNIAVTEEDFPVNPGYIQQILAVNSDFKILSTSKWANSLVLYCVDTNLLATVRAFSFVSQVMPVGRYDLSSGEGILPVLESKLVNTKSYDYGNSYGQIKIHNGDKLHDAGFQGEGLLIAVLDAGWSGFNAACFDNLRDNNQIAGTIDLIPGINNIYEGHSHGASVTSIMGSVVEGELVGTAPKANYFFIRSEDPYREQLIEEDFWAQAAEIADSVGADVINSSLGYTTFDDPGYVYTYAQCDGESSIASKAATIAGEKGIIVCASAGNLGGDEWHYIGRPADAKNILAVGAVSQDSVYASFSSTGPSYDGRVKPDVTSVGWGTFTCSYDYISPGNGTSYSCPVIAGLAACLWQALPQKSSLEIMQIIRENGHQYDYPDSLMGYGIPDFYKAYTKYAAGIRDEKMEETFFSFYPNPCHGELSIIAKKPLQNVEVELLDMQGKMIYTTSLATIYNTAQLSLNGIQGGIYFIKLSSSLPGNQKITQVGKIVKID